MAQIHENSTAQILGTVFSLAARGQLTWDDRSQDMMLELVKKHDATTSEEKPKYVQAIILSIDAIDPTTRFDAVRDVDDWADFDTDLRAKVFEKALPMIDIIPPEQRFDAARWVWSHYPYGSLEAAEKAFAAVEALPPERRLEAAEWVNDHATSPHTDGDLEKKAALAKKAQALIERLKPHPSMTIDEFVAGMESLSKPPAL